MKNNKRLKLHKGDLVRNKRTNTTWLLIRRSKHEGRYFWRVLRSDGTSEMLYEKSLRFKLISSLEKNKWQLIKKI